MGEREKMGRENKKGSPRLPIKSPRESQTEKRNAVSTNNKGREKKVKKNRAIRGRWNGQKGGYPIGYPILLQQSNQQPKTKKSSKTDGKKVGKKNWAKFMRGIWRQY